MKTVLCFTALLLLFISVQSMDLILLDKFSEAKCLDGTSPGYYFSKGSGEGSSKYLIHLEGGAWCQGTTADQILQACIRRSKTDLGSSKNWTKTFTNTANMSTEEQLNPAFYSWNLIYMKYCDGLTYQGNSKRTVSGTVLYFRGKQNMLALFNDLRDNRGLSKASKVVLSGSSAGGVAANNYSELLRGFLGPAIHLSTIVDSGFFVDDGWFNPKEMLLQLDIAYDNNRLEIIPTGCSLLLDDNEVYKCVQPVYNYKSLKAPTLMLLSNYDTYVLMWQKNVKCFMQQGPFFSFSQSCTPAERTTSEQLRAITVSELKKVVASQNNISVWAVSCINHMFMIDQPFYTANLFQAPLTNGVTAAQAVKEFVSNPNVQLSNIDISRFPDNISCSLLAYPQQAG